MPFSRTWEFKDSSSLELGGHWLSKLLKIPVQFPEALISQIFEGHIDENAVSARIVVDSIDVLLPIPHSTAQNAVLMSLILKESNKITKLIVFSPFPKIARRKYRCDQELWTRLCRSVITIFIYFYIKITSPCPSKWSRPHFHARKHRKLVGRVRYLSRCLWEYSSYTMHSQQEMISLENHSHDCAWSISYLLGEDVCDWSHSHFQQR